jgi:hypothetical protein
VAAVQILRFDRAPNGDFCYPSATPIANENGLPEGKPLIELVAGTGFEPVTFGL